ncbi:MAG TPA: trypsin-like peptidase domain-containing protein [Terriglobia bacterium]|nr:trypsin-like peptidase domain-containing protein [Terriglobia bacterium]
MRDETGEEAVRKFLARVLVGVTFVVASLTPMSQKQGQVRKGTYGSKPSTPAAQKAPAEIYRDNQDAIVFVQGEKKAGSGFFISTDGKVVTNYHVVSGEREVSVRLTDGLEFTVDEVIAQDLRSDLVILQLKGNGFKPVKLGDSDRVAPGDSVIVISNSLGLENSISNGLLSGVRHFEDGTFLQITAPISPGSSGGPVFDANGDVVGVADATVREGQNVNLAVPSKEITRILTATTGATKLSELAPFPAGTTTSLESEKLKRYIESEMWGEALDWAKEAVSKDEFDPVNRFVLGEALFRLGHYDQAVREFQTVRRIDPDLWQATERLADARLKMWETEGSLPKRVLACELYEELLTSPTKSDSDNVHRLHRLNDLFPKWKDATSARAEARDVLAQLESPEGTWVTEVGEAYIMKIGPYGWKLNSVASGSNSLTAFGTTSAQANSLGGQGIKSLGTCQMLAWVEVRTSEHATKMGVTITGRRGYATQGTQATWQMCQEMVGKLYVGKPFVERFERTQ